MLICIDSCVFIRALQDEGSEAFALLGRVSSAVSLVIPRLVAQEVTRNLPRPEQVKLFYRQFWKRPFAHIVDEPVPRELVLDYVARGLPGKADAFIGAFGAWLEIDYLVSDNRHFLRQLTTNAYEIVTPQAFLDLLQP